MDPTTIEEGVIVVADLDALAEAGIPVVDEDEFEEWYDLMQEADGDEKEVVLVDPDELAQAGIPIVDEDDLDEYLDN